MREKIAAIIDPQAFMPSEPLVAEQLDRLYGDRRRRALEKADEIIALEFSFEDLPADLQGTVELLGDAMQGRAHPFDALLPRVNAEGRPYYSGIFLPMEDGTLRVAVLLDIDPDDSGGEADRWATEDLKSDEVRRFVAELEVAAAGGGRA